MNADAARNAVARDIPVPVLYLRGDADGRSPEDYVPALRDKGARLIEADSLPGSGEISPLETGEQFTKRLRAFAESCRAPFRHSTALHARRDAPR
ncbi:MAG TPA: hypothetical protein VF033_15945 [Steroidobacteraceae bacterium]